jgi:hypothetical protein
MFAAIKRAVAKVREWIGKWTARAAHSRSLTTIKKIAVKIRSAKDSLKATLRFLSREIALFFQAADKAAFNLSMEIMLFSLDSRQKPRFSGHAWSARPWFLMHGSHPPKAAALPA